MESFSLRKVISPAPKDADPFDKLEQVAQKIARKSEKRPFQSPKPTLPPSRRCIIHSMGEFVYVPMALRGKIPILPIKLSSVAHDRLGPYIYGVLTRDLADVFKSEFLFSKMVHATTTAKSYNHNGHENLDHH